MFWKIFAFELKYRLKRPATYVYFFIFFFMTFMAVYSKYVGIGGEGGLVNKNSPYTINLVVMIMTIFGTMICSAIMGVPVFRDFEHNFHEIVFTTPVKKWEYLLGRFFGSYVIAIFVFSGLLFGNITGSVFPGVNPEHIGPFYPYAYIHSFLLYILPDLFIFGILFFAMGSYFRNQLAIYVQGVIIFALYLIIISNQRDIEHNRILSILDPFGFSATANLTRYWTVVEKNAQIIPFEGLLLYNRILWMIFSVIAGFIFYRKFKFSKSLPQLKAKKKLVESDLIQHSKTNIPVIHYSDSRKTRFRQWWFLVKFDFKGVIKAIPFLAITLCGIVMLIANASDIGSLYGTQTYPVTYMIIDILVSNFMLFLVIIIAFYSGELIWKEISVKLSPIIDATPLSSQLILLSKFTTMIFIELFLLCILVLAGMLIQAINGFYDFQLLVYIKTLMLGIFPYLLLTTFLTFFIHTLVNNKFLGHTLVIIFWIANIFLSANDINHNLIYYGNSPNTSYSAMNGLGHFVYPILMFDAYWLMIGIILLSLSVLMIKRGSELGFSARFRKMKKLWKAGEGRLIILVCFVIFIVCGGFIYYNTNVLNTYRSPKEERHLSADYEKKYRKYLNKVQPRITDIKVNVDIYPNERNCHFDGKYVIKNKSTSPIDSVIITLPAEAKINKLVLGIQSKKVLNDDIHGFYIYQLNNPLLPGDSTILEFDVDYLTHGFENDGGSTSVIYNGTFINNDLMPQFGYNDGVELNDDDRRKDENLPKKLYRMNPITDTIALRNTYISQDADWINYEAIVSTVPDQIAISPGYLQKEWIKNGRRYFHYKMDTPIWNFVSFLSARYEVLRDKHNGVNIEIYYHKGHEYDLNRMVTAIKKTLDYAGKNFQPYQHRQVRIIEFPRYQLFAQSFPNTIPFSEGIGFIMDVDKENDIDMAFYVTSHEVAHQWWGHQVCGGNVQGGTMMVESLAQYTALMVMEHEYGKNNMEKFLKYELDRYLRGRSSERKRELPIVLNENQQYIHYQKGSLVFYALKDYIGEDSLNAALSSFVKDYAFKDGPYPTTKDFMKYIRRVTPDSLQNTVTDLFERITLFNNSASHVAFAKSGNGYNVSLEINCKKALADSVGREKDIPLNDWIDIGVYGRGKDDKDSLIYLSKHLINKEKMKFDIFVSSVPLKAGIDPLHKLIDRDTEDNVKAAE
jgi:ABC-2 type transport system permease protein